MRAATLPTRPATGLHVADTAAELDALDAMTPDELEDLDRRIWREGDSPARPAP